MREMQSNQWVAFDVSTKTPHKHFKSSNPEKITPKKQKKSQSRSVSAAEYLIDNSGEKIFLNNLTEEWIDLNNDNKLKLFEYLIPNERSITIEYADAKGDETTRSIYPHHVARKKTALEHQIAAYCLLRSDFRSFLIDRVGELRIESKASMDVIKKTNDHYGMPTHRSTTSQKPVVIREQSRSRPKENQPKKQSGATYISNPYGSPKIPTEQIAERSTGTKANSLSPKVQIRKSEPKKEPFDIWLWIYVGIACYFAFLIFF